jgi:prevent-host-death family protein
VLKVPIDKIMPVTEIRANISKVVNDVENGDIYVLTRGGKPTAVIAPVDYIKKCDELDKTSIPTKKKVAEDIDVQKNTQQIETPQGSDLPQIKEESVTEPAIFENKPTEIVPENEQNELPATYQSEEQDTDKADVEQPVPIKVSSGNWN